jgi:hypothetical protein
MPDETRQKTPSDTDTLSDDPQASASVSVARSVIRDDLDPFDPPAECLTCGVPVPPREQYQVASVDGVPMWRVPDELQDVVVTEWAYCRPCFDARMTQAKVSADPTEKDRSTSTEETP